MSRITSIFLLQRLKGSMTGDARDFNNVDTRAAIRYFFLQDKPPKEIHPILKQILGEYAPSCATVKNRLALFKHGYFFTCAAPSPERLKMVTIPAIIDQILELDLEDSLISVKSRAEQLDISRDRVGSIIHEDFNMRKLSAKWVPICPNGNLKLQSCQSSE